MIFIVLDLIESVVTFFSNLLYYTFKSAKKWKCLKKAETTMQIGNIVFFLY